MAQRWHKQVVLLLIRVMLGSLGVLVAAEQCVAQSADTWTGQAQCQLTVQSPTYVYQEVQAWAITGPPDTNANTVYPATWSVTGQGGRQDSSGAQIVRAQWQTAVPPMNAPLRIFVNSGNQLIIKSYHAQLRMEGAAIGSRQVMVAGVAQNPTAVSFGEFEWQFPRIEVEATRTDVSGTSSSPVNSGVGPLQPPGTSATATCQWHFSKGEHSQTVLDRTPVPGASPQILQAPNGGANSSPSTPQSVSALPAPTQVARNPVAPTSNAAGSSNSSASVDANAGPAVYAAPSGVGAVTAPSGSSPVALQTPSQVASIGPMNPDGTALITSGSSTPTGSNTRTSLPNTHASISATATTSKVSLPAPTGFTAQSIGDGSVRLHWDAVSGASQYRVDGSGIAAAGLYVAAANSAATRVVPIATGGSPTSPSLGTRIQNVPPGPSTWHIAAVDAHKLYDPKLVSTTTTIVRYVPAHAGQWLTKNNGAGSFSKTSAHYLSLCPQCLPGVSFSDVLTALGVSSDALADGNNSADDCLYSSVCTWTDFHAARYQNATEFGTSRVTRCWEALPGNTGTRTVCYSNSGDHGVTVIVKESDLAWFLTFAWKDNAGTSLPNPAKEVVNWFGSTLGVPLQSNYVLTTQVTLDSEGPKSPPNACLSCHGGKFDGTRVTGATLLPLDTGLLRVDDRSDGMAANFLGVNQAVMNHGPSPAVKRYITGLYGGFDFPSGWGDLDYVPQGWKQQSDFYKIAVRPYCMMCHLATPSNLDFSTYGNFAQNKDVINAEVCSGHTMPHAEYPFKQFWTKDTGNIFLPGYLVASMGITSCQ